MNIFRKMYTKKPKRVVDPNAPPRPNLLSQVKVIKDVRTDTDNTRAMCMNLQSDIEKLRSELKRAHIRIEMLTNYIRSNRK